MFSCRCTSPWLPASSCAVHETKRGTHQVMLGRPHVVHQVNIPSDVKAAALSDRFCPNCNAQKVGGQGHICTRAHDEPESLPSPW